MTQEENHQYYGRAILALSFLLMIFPFLGMSELLENLYVTFLAFLIAFLTLRWKYLSEGDEQVRISEIGRKLRAYFSPARFQEGSRGKRRIRSIHEGPSEPLSGRGE